MDNAASTFGEVVSGIRRCTLRFTFLQFVDHVPVGLQTESARTVILITTQT